MGHYAIETSDKRARRENILEAARALFMAGNGTLPSASEIAVKSALAKGTVYLYFQTKEEIFAALLLEGWATLLEDVVRVFGKKTGSRAEKIATFLKVYIAYLDRHPDLLKLDALGYGVLERNLEPAKLKAFKSEFLITLHRCAAIVECELKLPEGQGTKLLMHTYAFTRGLWQSTPVGTFKAEATKALASYWRGALAN